ncbi:hypothetical protein cypCar_00024517 [Cyprinus carpio]|nr:hypothetical protein cypCar_00024517 [Cyprinus carpio]
MRKTMRSWIVLKSLYNVVKLDFLFFMCIYFLSSPDFITHCGGKQILYRSDKDNNMKLIQLQF